jgi:hypothetical protein
MTEDGKVLVSAIDSDGSLATRPMQLGERFKKNGAQILITAVRQDKVAFEVSTAPKKSLRKKTRRTCKVNRAIKNSESFMKKEEEDDFESEWDYQD